MIDYNKICEKYKLTPNDIAIPKRGKRDQVTIIELLNILNEHGSSAHTIIGLHNKTLSSYIKKLLPTIELQSFRRKTWNSWLLLESGYKKCYKCETIKPLTDFTSDSSRPDSKSKECKKCKAEYRITYKKLATASKAKERAKKLNSIAPWANFDKINKIYENCPDGYQVDHIYPLQGTNSCGLHVETNLQYLTNTDNKIKGSKLPEEVPHIIGIIPLID